MAAADASPLQQATVAVQALIDACGGRGVIIGGMALGLLAEARMTVDVDAVMMSEDRDVQDIVREAQSRGFASRSRDPVAFARTTRVLPLVHTATGAGVDLSLGALPFEEEMIGRARHVSVAGTNVAIPTPEDFIILKAIAHRPQDFADIRTIVETYPDLDRKRIERWVRDFADTLEMPELWDDIVPLLKAP